MISIMRRFTFDAAHRITNHPGKCRELHGHTWALEVTVAGPVDSVTGMVMDFGELKRRVADLLVDLDHTAILKRDDPLAAFVSRRYLLQGEPTSENLLEEIRAFLIDILPPQVSLTKLALWESPDSCATWTLG